MMFHSSALAFVVLTILVAPGSNAFQNGNNTPQKPPAANIKTKTASSSKTSASSAVAPTPSKPPMPFKWPIVGTLPDFLSRGGVDAMPDIYESMYHDYGPVYGMSLMGDDEMIFSDPRVFDQILRKEGKFPVGGAESATPFVDYYKENDMDFALQGMSRGPKWKEYRTAVNADMFVLWDTYLPTLAKTCREISSVAGKEVTEAKNQHISEFLSRAAFDMFSAVLYGESPKTTNSDEATPEDIAFVKVTKQAFDITGELMLNPMEKVFGSSLYKEFGVKMDTLLTMAKARGMKNYFSAVDIKAKYEAANEQQEQASSDSSGCPITAIKTKVADRFIPTEFADTNPSYIERLVNRDALSSEQIAEVQGPMLMAGVDTTAYVMGWFYLNMASNPEVQTKLANELDQILQGADVTTVEQMESLHYLKACFRESHRLTPPAPVSIKTLDEDIDVVFDSKSYTIPSGQRVSLNLRGLPMDPKFVENPTSYIPERFFQSEIQARKGTPSEIALDHPYMNDPFGRGKRRCLGANVAIAEMIVLAARLLQDWEISLEDPNEAVHSSTKTWTTKQKLMLIADPYPAMTLVPRKNKQ